MSDKEDGETIYFIDYYSKHEYSVVKIEEIPLEDCSIKSVEVQSAAICGAQILRINSESKNSVFSAIFKCGSPATFVNKKMTDRLNHTDRNAKLLSIQEKPIVTNAPRSQ